MLQKINWSAISPDESEKLKNELVEVWEAPFEAPTVF